jgi:hypothetical protein
VCHLLSAIFARKKCIPAQSDDGIKLINCLFFLGVTHVALASFEKHLSLSQVVNERYFGHYRTLDWADEE